MVFSPSQLELFVDLLGELKGAEAALAYFDKVEPNFDEMDAEAKNRPAYLKLLYWFRVKEESQTSGARTHVLKFPKVDDPQWAKNSTPTTPAQKRNLFSKLKSSETCCDHLLREMEDQGFCITKADLNRWIKLLEKQGHTQKALEVLSLLFFPLIFLCLFWLLNALFACRSTRLRSGNTFPFIINCVERLTVALFLGNQVTISLT